MEKGLSHDGLQFLCFRWLWNNYPELRYLFWGTFNDVKQVEKIIGPMSPRQRMVILSKMKSLGLVKGVLDFMFYYDKKLYVMDFKIGSDKLSKEQLEFIDKIKKQGGEGYEVRSLEQFKNLLQNILEK